LEDYPSFGRWLRSRRRALDLTQADLGRLAGYAEVTIRKIEADELRPSRGMAWLLAEHLRIPAEEREDFVRFARNVRAGEQSLASAAADHIPKIDLLRRLNNLPPRTTPLIGREEEITLALSGLSNMAGSKLMKL
jgi:transcriptional regulator with XRE-family HTH domain